MKPSDYVGLSAQLKEEFVIDYIRELNERVHALELEKVKKEPQNKEKIPISWQLIGYGLLRSKTIGGWILYNEDGNNNESICFIPDPNHEWEV